MILKRMFGLLFLLAVFILVFALLENNPRSVIGLLMKEDFPEATAVNFDVKLFGFIPVGNAVIEDKGVGVWEGRNVFRLGAYARPNFILSRFFESEIRISCFVDPTSLLPLCFQENLRVGKFKEESREVIYDQSNNVMISEGRRVAILKSTMDPLSAFNYIRKTNFNEVKYFDLNINSNQKNYILRAEVDEVHYRVRKKDVKVWRLTCDIRRRDKNPYHSSRVIVWILDNKTRTPLFVKILFPKFFYSAKVSNVR